MPLLSIIFPTINEEANLKSLIPLLELMLKKAKLLGEIIIVDDNSTDNSLELIHTFQKEYQNVRIIVRKQMRGVTSAVLTGFRVAHGEILSVMDADFSHPPSLLPVMFQAINNTGKNMAVASRYVAGGGTRNWPLFRRMVSKVAKTLVFPITSVHDPLSGFFAIRRSVISQLHVNPIGNKIVLAILANKHLGDVQEVPFIFKDRKFGRSKLNLEVILKFLVQIGLIYIQKFLG